MEERLDKLEKELENIREQLRKSRESWDELEYGFKNAMCNFATLYNFELPEELNNHGRKDCDNNSFDDTKRGLRYFFTFLGSFLGALIGMLIAGLLL